MWIIYETDLIGLAVYLIVILATVSHCPVGSLVLLLHGVTHANWDRVISLGLFKSMVITHFCGTLSRCLICAADCCFCPLFVKPLLSCGCNQIKVFRLNLNLDYLSKSTLLLSLLIILTPTNIRLDI